MSGHNSGAVFIAKLLRHCGTQGVSLVHSKCAISAIVPSQIWTHPVSGHTQVVNVIIMTLCHTLNFNIML